MTTEIAANPADTTQGADQQADGGNAGGNGASQSEQGQQDQQTQNTEQAKPETGSELVYDFKTPEGVQLDQTSVDELKAIAKEHKLPVDAAQKVLDIAIRREQANREHHIATVKGWAESVKADKELGGDKLDATLATAKKAIDLGPPELKELLNASGFGNHPAVVKWAYAVGKALSEDSFVAGNKGGDKPTSTASRLFPNMNP